LAEQRFPRTIAPIAEKIAKTLQERVGELCNNDLLRISMLLDPRFAYDTIFFTPESWKIVEQLFDRICQKKYELININFKQKFRSIDQEC
jgi:hypothetical protein